MPEPIDTCPIWGTPAVRKQYDNAFYDSLRAGGWYSVHWPGSLEKLTGKQRVLLTDWLVEQRKLGPDIPVIDRDVIETIKTRKAKSPYQRAVNLLRWLRDESPSIGDVLIINDEYRSEPGEENIEQMNICYKGLVASSSERLEELVTLLEYCEHEKWVEIRKNKGTLNQNFNWEIMLTVEGWQHLHDLDHVNRNSKQAFIAMWFNETLDPYLEAASEVILELGFEPIRIDQVEHENKIDDEIIAQIKRSRFVVADFTCDPPEQHRGGVYFEAGFAMGLGIKVIWTCRQDAIDHVHFDTRQYPHIVWQVDELNEFKVNLRNRIQAQIIG